MSGVNFPPTIAQVPASAARSGYMTRWATGTSTIASFAVTTKALGGLLYVPLVTSTMAGALGSADYNILKNLAACRVLHNANQSIATATITQLAYNTERFDTNGFHDTATNNGRLTVPAGLGGLYLITLTAQWNATAGGGRRIFAIRHQGTTVIAQFEAQPNGAATFPGATVTTLYRLAAAEYVDTYAYQDSGGAVNVLAAAAYTPEFSLVRLAD